MALHEQQVYRENYLAQIEQPEEVCQAAKERLLNMILTGENQRKHMWPHNPTKGCSYIHPQTGVKFIYLGGIHGWTETDD